MKKLPPFGWPLANLVKQGFCPNDSVYLWIGNWAWRKGKSFSLSFPTRCLVLPPWECATLYRWPVRHCDILIIGTGYDDAYIDYVDDLVYRLYCENARIVRYLNIEHNLTIYHKE